MSYQIADGCVGCHYCALECPVGAIRIMGKGYRVEEEKCVSCGKCAKVCHLGLPYDVEYSPAPLVSQKKETITADVVVIGAGGVGLGAAARAAFLGLDTVLLEAAERFGGGTFLAHGASFPGSQTVYKRLGLDTSIDSQVGFWNMIGHGNIKDQELLRKNVAANGAFLDWFDSLDPKNCAPFVKAKEGFPFPFDLPERYLNTRSTDNSIGPGWTGSWICERLFDACKKYGVRYYPATRASRFIKDEHGTVTQVESVSAEALRTFEAKRFVIATGSFLMDDEALAKIDPEFVENGKEVFRITVPTNRGDGQRMVRDAGGMVDTSFMRTRGPSHHPYTYAVNLMMMNPENVFFNETGKRFFEIKPGPPGMPGDRGQMEEASPGDLILKSKSGVCYLVMDSDQLAEYGARLIEQADPVHDAFAGHWSEDVEAECALEDRPARKADTIRELAQKLGMDADLFEQEIETYNKACDDGADDPAFGKDPKFMRKIKKAPFYAFLGQNFENGASLGGVETDKRFHVVKQGGGVFEELFCAGDCATYIPAEDRGVVGLCGGLGGSFASGFQIANYISDEMPLASKQSAGERDLKKEELE